MTKETNSIFMGRSSNIDSWSFITNNKRQTSSDIILYEVKANLFHSIKGMKYLPHFSILAREPCKPYLYFVVVVDVLVVS